MVRKQIATRHTHDVFCKTVIGHAAIDAARSIRCSSPGFPFGSGGTPEGTRYTKVLPPSSRRQATVHRTVAFKFSSPFYWEYKNGVSPRGYTRNKTFPFHPHPYGVRLEWERTLPRAKNSPPDCFYGSCAAAALSSPAWSIKNSVSQMGYAIFGTPEGTRTPDLLIRSQSLYPTELLAHVAID